jgi:hypothetical protein
MHRRADAPRWRARGPMHACATLPTRDPAGPHVAGKRRTHVDWAGRPCTPGTKIGTTMDVSRDPGSGLFNRSELPQSYGTERAPLAPIAGRDAADEAPRARASSVPRLAVAAKASTGSGLIDLDEVARSLEQKRAGGSDAAPAPVARAAVAAAASVPVATASADSEPLPVAPAQRGLLLASIALLVVVASLLGYLALA